MKFAAGATNKMLMIGEPNDLGAAKIREYQRLVCGGDPEFFIPPATPPPPSVVCDLPNSGSMAGQRIDVPDKVTGIATAVRNLVVPASIRFSHQFLPSENTFSLLVKFNQGADIEKPTQPQPMQVVKHNAKHPSATFLNIDKNYLWRWSDRLGYFEPSGNAWKGVGGAKPDTAPGWRGYGTQFSWTGSEDYMPYPSTKADLVRGIAEFESITRFTFGWKFFGRFNGGASAGKQ